MNNRQIFYWILFNIVLISLWMGLVSEIVNEGYSWNWAISALVLIFSVNISIYLDKFANVEADE